MSSTPTSVSSMSATRRFGQLLWLRWRNLPVFWRFQLMGWFIFLLLWGIFKAIVLDSAYMLLISMLLHDSFAFLLTVLLHRYYLTLPSALSVGAIARHVVFASLLATAVDAVWFSQLRALVFESSELPWPGTVGLLGVASNRFMLYLSWSFLYFWIKAALQHIAARSDANKAQLQALRAQMNPHFLFNALNSIASEADDNPKAVKALAHELASYLRYSLAHRNEQSVTLAAEVEATTHYLNVEKIRFEERLEFSVDVSAEARMMLVPGFFLQPLIENAVKHGLQANPGAMRIVIRAACTADMLRLEVGNTGVWREGKPVADHQGFGLESIRARLKLLYPNSHRFEISHGNGWVNIILEIPRA